MAVVFGIATLIFAIMICCGKDSLGKAIDVIDAAADFIRDTKRIILVPILHFFITIIVSVLWMGCMLCIAATNEISVSMSDRLIPQARSVEWSKQSFYMSLYMLFGWFWLTAFIEYCSNFIAIVAATTYYFNNNRD